MAEENQKQKKEGQNGNGDTHQEKPNTAEETSGGQTSTVQTTTGTPPIKEPPSDEQAPPETPDKDIEKDKKRIWLGIYLMVVPIFILLFIVNFWPIEDKTLQPEDVIKKKTVVQEIGEGESRITQISEDKTVPIDTNSPKQENNKDKNETKKNNWSKKMVLLPGTIPFQLRVLILILLSGMMGSYIHTATSFAYHMGAKDFHPSWYWWYIMRLPIGAGLAFVFTLLFRSGFYVMQNNNSTDISDPIATIGLAALVGLFAPQALDKLGDVFTVVFNPKDRSPKNNTNGNDDE